MERPAWKDIFGWFCDADAVFVANLCRLIKNGHVVELGPFAGRATAVMAPICIANGCRYTAIDNFEGGDPEDEATVVSAHKDIQSLFVDNMIALGLDQRVQLEVFDAIGASQFYGRHSIDLCFIDTDHRAGPFRKHLEAWAPKINPDGYLAGHDYGLDGIKPVLQGFAEREGLVLTPASLGSCWALHAETTQCPNVL